MKYLYLLSILLILPACAVKKPEPARVDSGKYPWGPGEVFRYRGTGTTVVAAAMQTYFATKEGAQADRWESLTREVLVALGIDRLPIARTIEVKCKPGVALMCAGMYPTFEEVVDKADADTSKRG